MSKTVQTETINFRGSALRSQWLLQIFIMTVVGLSLLLLMSCTFYFFGLGERAPEVYSWVKDVYYLGKRSQMIFFMLSVPTIFIALACFRLFVSDRLVSKFKLEILQPAVPIDFLLVGLAAVSLSYAVSAKLDIAMEPQALLCIILIQSLILFFVPIIFLMVHARNKIVSSKIFELLNSRFFIYIAVGLMFGVQAIVYAPIAFNRLPYLNEYLNIQSQLTKPVGEASNSIDAINSIPQAALRLSTVTNPDDRVVRPTLSVSPSYFESANAFAQRFERSEFPIVKSPYYYDVFTHVLVASAPILPASALELSQATGASVAEAKTFIERTNERERIKSLAMSPSVLNELEDLRFNLTLQMQGRWYFHHHNFCWGPALKFTSGIKKRNIFFQYGLIGATLQYAVTKFVMGGFNIPNYFLLWSVLFGLYFLVFHLCVYAITKSRPLTICSSILFVTFLFSQHYEYIFLGPGLNPIRHFLDIPAFMMAFFFFRSRSKMALAGLLLLTTANFALNPEFGIFCSAALFFTVGVYLWANRAFDRSMILLGIGALFAHIILRFALKTGPEAAVGLYLGGFFSPTLANGKVFLFQILASGAVTVLLFWTPSLRKMRPEGFLLFASLLYLVEIFVYPLFGMTWNHIVNISPIIVFVAIIAANFLSFSYEEFIKPLIVAVTAISLGGLAYSGNVFLKTRAAYSDELAKYKIERWHNSDNPLLTQIPEQPIEDSMKLIKKYDGGTAPIVMFSNYNNLLPMLSQRALALPGNEVAGMLFSKTEYQEILLAAQRLNPTYIFTDRNITDSGVDELIDPNTQIIGQLYQESKMRLDRESYMKALFREIQPGYEKIDESGLLAVWKRK